MGKSLYRSYRSKSFDEIIGQDHITTTLLNSIKNKAVSHAYLLSGPRGVGKTSIARILAHAVNETDYDEVAVNLDIIEIDAASNRRIDEIREIRERVNTAPVAGKYKVYIIDEVHMLTREAFNALLKTLEEPPAHVIFILATTEAHKVPETILSRCIRLTFRPIEKTVLEDHLKKIAKSEKITITDEAIGVIAEHGRGSFRDAISILDQVKNFGDKITINDVNMILGLASEKKINNIISAIESSNLPDLKTTLDQAFIEGSSEMTLASQISDKLRSNMITGGGNLTYEATFSALKELLDVPGSQNPRIALELCLYQLASTNNVATATKEPPKAAKPNRESELEPKSKPDTTKTSQSETSSKPEVSLPVKAEEPQVVKKITSEKETTPTQKVENNQLWEEFLKVLKTKNNTLYSIARIARTQHDEGVMELIFKFKFHYKQISDAKNKQLFSEIFNSLSEDPIEIKVTLEESQTPTVDNTSPESAPVPIEKPVNKGIETISNIFGGAEMLES